MMIEAMMILNRSHYFEPEQKDQASERPNHLVQCPLHPLHLSAQDYRP